MCLVLCISLRLRAAGEETACGLLCAGHVCVLCPGLRSPAPLCLYGQELEASPDHPGFTWTALHPPLVVRPSSAVVAVINVKVNFIVISAINTFAVRRDGMAPDLTHKIHKYKSNININSKLSTNEQGCATW